jgi:dTMP kinase
VRILFNKFIALEGVDGSGKSSVIKELSIKLGAKIVELPSGEIRMVKYAFDDPKVSQKARYLFYLSCLVETSEIIRKELKKGNGVFSDRYLYSVIAYPVADKLNINFVDTDQLGIIQPFRTICLTASKEVRIERIKMRENSLKELAVQKIVHIEKIDKLLRGWSDVVIDTSNLLVGQTVSKIIQYLQDEGGL